MKMFKELIGKAVWIEDKRGKTPDVPSVLEELSSQGIAVRKIVRRACREGFPIESQSRDPYTHALLPPEVELLPFAEEQLAEPVFFSWSVIGRIASAEPWRTERL